MLAFPGMLVSAAEKAGMKVPPDPDEYDPNQYPHFYVFCTAQLSRPMHPGEHCDNAKIIANISDEEIKKVTLAQLIEFGFIYKE